MCKILLNTYRLLADVLSKIGVVERSGQGMNKIFLYTLAEGKPE